MTIRKSSSESVLVKLVAKKAVPLPTRDLGATTATGQTKGVHYANGDGYVGELKNGRRHGEGVYAFTNNIKVQVTRADKAVQEADTLRYKKGATIRTKPNKHSGEINLYMEDGLVHRPPSREHRPVEEFQGAKLVGKWKNDELIEGEIKVLNRQGSTKTFKINGRDLNLITSSVEGQHLTMRTFSGDGAVPVKLPQDKEIYE